MFKDKDKIFLVAVAVFIACASGLISILVYRHFDNKNMVKSSPKTETKKVVTINEKDSIDDNNYFTDEDNSKDNANVVSYIEETVDSATESVDNLEDNKNSESKLKNTFITLTDFIFYDGTIKGHTFKELREEEKQKVISLWEKLDQKIESKYPNYKDTIKDNKDKVYSNISEKAATLKEKIKTTIDEKVSEDVKEQVVEDKNNLKEATKPYTKKVKDAYTKAKEKVSDWYNNYKNK